MIARNIVSTVLTRFFFSGRLFPRNLSYCGSFVFVLVYIRLNKSNATVALSTIARVAFKAKMKNLTGLVGKTNANTADIRNRTRLSSDKRTVSDRGKVGSSCSMIPLARTHGRQTMTRILLDCDNTIFQILPQRSLVLFVFVG
jgi:hypothetical protein